jgi:hypothetical protein
VDSAGCIQQSTAENWPENAKIEVRVSPAAARIFGHSANRDRADAERLPQEREPEIDGHDRADS